METFVMSFSSGISNMLPKDKAGAVEELEKKMKKVVMPSDVDVGSLHACR